MDQDNRASRLAWQSRLILLAVAPACAVWMAVALSHPDAAKAWAALVAGLALAALVWRARAATLAGACLGGLLLACFCLTTPGWRSSAWALIAMLMLTLGATRVGRRLRRTELSTEDALEQKRGRGAAQVAANLGVAALAGRLANAYGQQPALCVLLAALGEAAADTLASELGQAVGGTPRLITTLRKVPIGSDGGMTLAGTLIGVAGATAVVGVGVTVLALPAWTATVAVGAGAAGLLFDSLLGATLERAGWLSNDAVNFLSTLCAAGLALAAAELLRLS